MKCSLHLRFKLLNIGLYFLIGAFAMMVVLGMGWSSLVANGKCVLYSKMDISMQNGGTASQKNNSFILGKESTFGNDSLCQYCTYFSVMSVIYAIIGLWFYLLIYQDYEKKEYDSVIGNYKKSALSPELQLWLPNIICLSSYFLCAFVSSILIADGRNSWCRGIESSLQRKDPNSRCVDVSAYPWSLPGGQKLYMYLTASEVGAFGLCGFIAVKLASLVYRVSKRKDQIIFDKMGIKKKKIEDILQQERLLPENDPQVFDPNSSTQMLVSDQPGPSSQGRQEGSVDEVDGATSRKISAVPRDSIMNKDNEPLIILESTEEMNKS